MELKSNELRIGNLVQSKENRPFEITLEDLIFIEAGSTCKPIQLTEEWLLKCNFNFRNFGREFSVSNHLLSGNFYFMISGFGKQIYYLHELQNLYFTLTNKELEIKM